MAVTFMKIRSAPLNNKEGDYRDAWVLGSEVVLVLETAIGCTFMLRNGVSLDVDGCAIDFVELIEDESYPDEPEGKS
jgi:hypothetical protein